MQAQGEKVPGPPPRLETLDIYMQIWVMMSTPGRRLPAPRKILLASEEVTGSMMERTPRQLCSLIGSARRFPRLLGHPAADHHHDQHPA